MSHADRRVPAGGTYDADAARARGRRRKQGGKWVGVPYGSIARLIPLYLQTETATVPNERYSHGAG